MTEEKKSDYTKVFKWKEGDTEVTATCTTKEQAREVIAWMILRSQWQKDRQKDLEKIEKDSKERIAKKKAELGAEFDRLNASKVDEKKD
jgi:hypothetical protein